MCENIIVHMCEHVGEHPSACQCITDNDNSHSALRKHTQTQTQRHDTKQDHTQPGPDRVLRISPLIISLTPDLHLTPSLDHWLPAVTLLYVRDEEAGVKTMQLFTG